MNKYSLEPQKLWDIFEVFCLHPRPSKHEESVLRAIESLCDENRLKHVRDDIGNLIIQKPATTGMEDRKCVVMQGHIDMVPQKNNDSGHDFLTDPIRTHIIEDEHGKWLAAKGTTLGADNGIGVASGLAVLLSNDIQHGPLELLITIDEEAGMTGAKGLEPGWLDAEILLNLDTEDEGELYVGCAGGVDISAKIPVEWKDLPHDQSYSAYEFSITGLRGGHSGLDINQGRGNAIKLINRFLLEYATKLGINIFDFNGGTLRNAIPREGFVKVVIPSSNQADLEKALDSFIKTIKNEYGSVEPHLSIGSQPVPLPKMVLTSDFLNQIIHTIAACTHGVTRMSPDFEDTVESSNNLAIVETDEDHVNLHCLARSLSDTARDDLARSIQSVFLLAGAKTRISGDYPGWKPNPESRILRLMSEVHESEFGYVPKIKVIHAGLECGLLGKPYPHWDMISFGPTIRHAHSPDEKVHIQSVNTFWKYLLAVLKNIPVKD